MDVMMMDNETVDDTKCVLLEFEDETVAVGYLTWITSHNNENYIQNVIEKHLNVVIRWPNCSIGPANKMRRALQKCNEWSRHVVKVVAYGDWTIMCTQLSTYIKCDDLNPGKHERKLHAKKKISESEDEEENKTKRSLKKQKKETAKLKSNAKNTIGCAILQKLKTKSHKDKKFSDNDINMILPVFDDIKTEDLYISEKKDEFQKNPPTPNTLDITAEVEEISKADGASSSKVNAKEMNSKETIDIIKPKVSSTTSKICNDASELNRYFGNRLVTKAQLAKLNDSSLSKLTCDLLTIVFDKKELKESSLTGQKTNANKNKDTIKKLDPDRLAAVEEYVYKNFGKTNDNIKLFRGAVRTKCNNAKKVTSVNNRATATADK